MNTHAGAEDSGNFGGLQPKQHMELHNLSSSSAFPSLSPSTLPPSHPPSPTTFTTTSGSPAHCLPASSPKVSAFLVPTLGVEFILGLVGNSLALFIFCVHT